MTAATVIDVMDNTFLPTIDDLVLVARAGGERDATGRTIHYWRSRDLVSKPSRDANGYHYPLAALGEVDGIVRWGFSQTRADLVRFARYIEALLLLVQLGGAGGQLEYCLSAVLLARAGVGSRRARDGAPGGADDAEDVFVELAGEAGFESCTCYIRGSGAVRSWPRLQRRRRERRRRVVASSDR
jgi:hypothetical protein